MIPKILWHIWISDKECPEGFKKYTDTWSQFMPDYEIRYITLKDVPVTPFTEKLIAEKKWSLVNHWVRYSLLYLRGGIYMDLDMEVVKSFDDLLDNKLILGYEDDKILNNAVMGCEKGNEFMQACVEEMERLDYDQDRLELKTGPWLTTKLKDFQTESAYFPPEYFYPYHYSKEFTPECITPNTHTIHHWTHSWEPGQSKL